MTINTRRMLWFGIGTGLTLLIGGRFNISLAAWIAPVLLLRFFRSSEKPWREGALLWLVTAATAIISWKGATFLNNVHPLAESGLFLVTGLIGMLPLVIDRAYYRRYGSSFWLSFVYPVAATAIDFLSGGDSPFGSFGAAAYSQRDFLPIMQFAAITGIWGIGFVIAWFASLLNYAWDQGLRVTKPMLLAGMLLVLILGWGFGRSLLTNPGTQTARVAGFSLPTGTINKLLPMLGSGDEQGFRQAVDKLHAQELVQIRTLAQQGANIVVLQEGAGLGYSDQVEELISAASAIAKEERIYIVLPTMAFGPAQPENIVRIIDPSGSIVLEHVKYGGNQFEGSLKGDGILRSVDTPYGRLSAIICWDADFPNIVRQAGQQQLDLLFIPANDWLEVKDIHAGMATFRAVENGMAIFRQTGQGVSLVTDSYGRVIERVDTFQQPSTGQFEAVHITETRLASVPTLYPRIGDIFGSMMQIGALGLLIALVVRRPWAWYRTKALAS